MKSTLEFNLPEDKEDLDIALNGRKYLIALYEFDKFIFRVNKHVDAIPQEHLDLIQEKWSDCIDGLDLSI